MNKYQKAFSLHAHKRDALFNSLDKKINIKWPRKNFLISKKDKMLKSFDYFKKKYKFL